MSQRQLFLAAYDIADPKRLAQGLKILRAYATGGQKSVFECFLLPQERRDLVLEVDALIEPADDRFFLVRLDPRGKVQTLGIGVRPTDPRFFYLG